MIELIKGIRAAYSEVKKLRQYKKDWFEENAPWGRKLGYPECCIKEFCDQPPQILKLYGTNNNDVLRYKASLINSKYSGFIPCINHAKEVLSGVITLDSLIKNRSDEFPKFPLL